MTAMTEHVTVRADDLRWALRFMSVDGDHSRDVKNRLALALPLENEPERATDSHLIGLACGHFWPGDNATDADALTFLDMLRATNDTTVCPTCHTTQAVTGPAARVLR